jgi:hypothetical protein
MLFHPKVLHELKREVSSTPAEFAHGLRNAFGAAVRGGPLHFDVDSDGAAMRIDLTPGPDRVIALLRLPTLDARIRFTAGSPEARRQLLHRMDRAMQRGGG